MLSPEKVVCVGMNYRDHCLEQNAPIPKEPIIFSKFPSAITGPYDDIIIPSESQVRESDQTLVRGIVFDQSVAVAEKWFNKRINHPKL